MYNIVNMLSNFLYKCFVKFSQTFNFVFCLSAQLGGCGDPLR